MAIEEEAGKALDLSIDDLEMRPMSSLLPSLPPRHSVPVRCSTSPLLQFDLDLERDIDFDLDCDKMDEDLFAAFLKNMDEPFWLLFLTV